MNFVADDDLTKAFKAGRISEARYALDRARSLFALGKVRARYGYVAKPDPRSATMILRDLVLRKSKLSAADRRVADQVLARPTSPSDGEVDYGAATDESTCTTEFCIHWAGSGVHSPDLTDASANGIPDWIDGVVQEYEYIIGTFRDELGYLSIKSDLESPDNGGSALPDVYLADVGGDGLYGYCTTDDPNIMDAGTSAYPGWDMSAYCVIDNDFAEFPTNTPFENMQVTAAHETFHAVQFAYDIGDDSWLMEATSTWMEDVMYDDVNDNYQYLFMSPLTYPDVPMDYMDNADFFILRYGDFLFFRFLTEYFANGSPDNDLIREIWERASARAGTSDVDDFSATAIANALAARGADFADVFGDFGAFNWVIELFYEEGADYFQYLLDGGADPRPYVAKTHRISKGKPKTGNWQIESFHLTTTNVVFVPKKGVKSGAKILVKVNGPGSATSPEARYVIFYKTGLPVVGVLNLDGQGDGKKKLAFGKGTVSYVVLAMSNASVRYDSCYSGTTLFSCFGGIPVDDGAKFIWSGTLKQ